MGACPYDGTEKIEEKTGVQLVTSLGNLLAGHAGKGALQTAEPIEDGEA